MATQTDRTPAPDPTAPPSPELVSPNQYHLTGGGLTISYYPDGYGPIGPSGATQLVYQDGHDSLTFVTGQVRILDVADLGTLLSVTIQKSVDVGSTTFTLLLPSVQLPASSGSSAPITTQGITATHRILAGAIGHAQRETYVVTPLSGTASQAALPM